MVMTDGDAACLDADQISVLNKYNSKDNVKFVSSGEPVHCTRVRENSLCIREIKYELRTTIAPPCLTRHVDSHGKVEHMVDWGIDAKDDNGCQPQSVLHGGNTSHGPLITSTKQ